jgi:serine/threonine protein kinase
VKILDKGLMDAAQLQRLRLEIDIMRLLSHPGIVQLREVVDDADVLYLVMEYVDGGELQSYITKRGRLEEAEARRIFRQVVTAVAYCHARNVIHRDIKHKNILLDRNCNAKLIDFGLSNFSAVDEGGLRSTFCGTPAYAAPEMVRLIVFVVVYNIDVDADVRMVAAADSGEEVHGTRGGRVEFGRGAVLDGVRSVSVLEGGRYHYGTLRSAGCRHHPRYERVTAPFRFPPVGALTWARAG